MKYFEDINVGGVTESTTSYELTSEEIISYCKKWDPLPFHIDEAEGAKSIVGKLFTSASHSMAIAIRISHDMQQEPTAIVAGLGWDEVRFLTPACVGDRLRLRGEIVDTRPSKSNPESGIIKSFCHLINQHGQTVISFKTASLVQKRPTD